MTHRTQENEPHSPAAPSIADLAASIRRVRKARGWTLKDVEEHSQGKWKAVVIGSYERCDRALSLNKAIALAAFYRVPLDELLGIAPTSAVKTDRITFDIPRIQQSTESSLKALQRFVVAISTTRRDWNGELLSVRASDTLALASAMNIAPEQLHSALEAYGLVFTN